MPIYEDLESAVISIVLIDKQTINAEFCFHENLPLFSGHFPQKPILPGIIMVELVRYTVEKATGESYDIKSVLKAKFSQQILPGQSLFLTVRLDDGFKLAKTVATSNGKPVAKVTIELV